MDIETLLKRHPLRVFYPHGGRQFLLSWHCHNKQWSVVAAPSLRATLSTVEVIARKHQDARLGRFVEVDVVRPPRNFQEAYALRRYHDEVDLFYAYIAGNLTDWKDGRPTPVRAPPKGVLRCPGYEPRTPDDEDYGLHEGCRHCRKGYLPAEGTHDSFYESKRDHYLTIEKGPYTDSRLRDPKGPEADARPVYVLGCTFSRGLDLDPDARDGGLGDETAFLEHPQAPWAFFQVVQELPTTDLTERITAIHGTYNQRMKQQAEDATKRRREEKKRHTKAFKDLFR